VRHRHTPKHYQRGADINEEGNLDLAELTVHTEAKHKSAGNPSKQQKKKKDSK
jgi:hypothetical protein